MAAFGEKRQERGLHARPLMYHLLIGQSKDPISEPVQDKVSSTVGPGMPLRRMKLFSPLPTGDFPGVDQREVFEFLERHGASGRGR